MKRAHPHQRRRTPTIRDVAREAGVGVATVSRVLNDSPSVSVEAQARVREAIEHLAYRRSSTARALSVGRTQSVGVVAPFFTSSSVVERLRGVVDHLSRNDYDVVLFAVETPRQRTDAFRDFARRDRIDGLLVISLRVSDDELAALRRDRLPVVLVDVAHATIPHVVIDDVRGGELATEHLLAQGHRRIGFIGDIPAGPSGFTSSEQRREGYERALRLAGIGPDPALQMRGAFGRREARALARRLLGHADRPTAVFAASDDQAIGVLEGAADLGLRVPEDVAVIGFDDTEMAAVIGLTTVRQPLLETGIRGARLLVAAIGGAAGMPDDPLQPLTVVERRTT